MTSATTETEFRHKIGDALFTLHIPYDSGAEETIMYPIVKRTEHYAYVNGRHYHDRDKLIRFSVADLESKGNAYNRARHLLLHTRPLPHWPVMPAEVHKPEQRAIGRP
jgi:hypothetical protein